MKWNSLQFINEFCFGPSQILPAAPRNRAGLPTRTTTARKSQPNTKRSRWLEVTGLKPSNPLQRPHRHLKARLEGVPAKQRTEIMIHWRETLLRTRVGSRQRMVKMKMTIYCVWTDLPRENRLTFQEILTVWLLVSENSSFIVKAPLWMSRLLFKCLNSYSNV